MSQWTMMITTLKQASKKVKKPGHNKTIQFEDRNTHFGKYGQDLQDLQREALKEQQTVDQTAALARQKLRRVG
jgi:hypothetical protein